MPKSALLGGLCRDDDRPGGCRRRGCRGTAAELCRSSPSAVKATSLRGHRPRLAGGLSSATIRRAGCLAGTVLRGEVQSVEAVAVLRRPAGLHGARRYDTGPRPDPALLDDYFSLHGSSRVDGAQRRGAEVHGRRDAGRIRCRSLGNRAEVCAAALAAADRSAGPRRRAGSSGPAQPHGQHAAVARHLAAYRHACSTAMSAPTRGSTSR